MQAHGQYLIAYFVMGDQLFLSFRHVSFVMWMRSLVEMLKVIPRVLARTTTPRTTILGTSTPGTTTL